MLTLMCLGGLVTAALGWGLKIGLESRYLPWQITLTEFKVTLALMLGLVIPLTCWLGMRAALRNQASYFENRHGWEISTRLVRERCHEDGSMRHYWVETRTRHFVETYRERGSTHFRIAKRQEQHKIPYTTEEWTFMVHSSVGDVPMGEHCLPDKPDGLRYRKTVPVPAAPDADHTKLWVQAKERIDNNRPGPVTVRGDYPNYILSSHQTILRRTSDSVAFYKQAGLLPDLAIQPTPAGHSDQVYFVGTTALPGQWQSGLHQFNAALGQLLQGDLHLVVVDAANIADKERYGNALLAHWLAPERGRNALAKNTIVVILGARQGRIAWAQAYTGMPMGNEAMLQQLSNELPGVALEPHTLLGSAYARLLNEKEVKVFPTQGVLERIIITGPSRFQRVSMGGEGGGFQYLFWELQPTPSQQASILGWVTLFACVAWSISFFLGPVSYRRIERWFSSK